MTIYILVFIHNGFEASDKSNVIGLYKSIGTARRCMTREINKLAKDAYSDKYDHIVKSPWEAAIFNTDGDEECRISIFERTIKN